MVIFFFFFTTMQSLNNGEINVYFTNYDDKLVYIYFDKIRYFVL